MFKVQGLVWAIKNPAGHLIYAWWEQITRYIIFLSESWKSPAGVFATNLLNLNFI